MAPAHHDWNVRQCIGNTRILPTLAYLRTGALWVSALAHRHNDWPLLSVGLLSGQGPTG